MHSRRTRWFVARCLADAFLAGPWEERGLVSRAGDALEPRPAWIEPLVRSVLRGYARAPADRPRELAAFIALQLETASWATPSGRPRVRRWLIPELAMGRRPWPVPELTSVAALARFLGLGLGQLDWLADVRGLERTVTDRRLRNYHYTWLPRRGGPPRVIERPKLALRNAQRRVLHDVLDWIPAHDAAHGFTRGRSALSAAASHTRREVVLRLDLEDFFASVAAARVYGIFRAAGYPEPVAHTLTGLATNAVPVEEWSAVPRPARPELLGSHYRLGRRLATPHLPQGAPTSPALANLAAFRLDRRLAGLAGAVGATYTRYADDIALSGTRRLLGQLGRLHATVAVIAREEGFVVNARKSVVATSGARQQVCGIVVNERPNAPREEYDELRAILHNAARHGPAAENRAGVPDFRAHLLGRIAWMESLNPARGEKLRAGFARIRWQGD